MLDLTFGEDTKTMSLSKYVEERFPRFFTFGIYDGEYGDITTATNNPLIPTVPLSYHESIIEDRDKVIDMLTSLAIALNEHAPQAFKEIWYDEISI